jgi:hypothetical protein
MVATMQPFTVRLSDQTATYIKRVAENSDVSTNRALDAILIMAQDEGWDCIEFTPTAVSNHIPQ